MRVTVESPKTFTVTNLNPKPMVEALRSMADKLESGEWRYVSGGLLMMNKTGNLIELSGDLVLEMTDV